MVRQITEILTKEEKDGDEKKNLHYAPQDSGVINNKLTT
jgi:hypothetical protein